MSDELTEIALESSPDAATGTLSAQLETEKRLLANAEAELESARGEVEAWVAEVAKQARRVAEIESALGALRG